MTSLPLNNIENRSKVSQYDSDSAIENRIDLIIFLSNAATTSFCDTNNDNYK
jgi:hypothetical protein